MDKRLANKVTRPHNLNKNKSEKEKNIKKIENE